MSTLVSREMRESGTPEGAFALLRRRLSSAILDVYRDYGLRAEPVPAEAIDPDEVAVFAVIGFVGNKMCGSLVLRASPRSVDAWRAAFGVAGPVDACDILGELANMVLGRMKGRLSADGLPILMSTPTTARGAQMTLAATVGPEHELTFAGDEWSVVVRANAFFDPDFGLDEPSGSAEAEPGDVLLF